MSEDIHKWTDGRYVLMFDEHTFFVFDNVKEERMTALNVTKKLNEQQSTIEHLTVEKFKENKRFTKLLSEQQATISALKEENEQLRQSVEYWQKKYEEGTETFQID